MMIKLVKDFNDFHDLLNAIAESIPDPIVDSMMEVANNSESDFKYSTMVNFLIGEMAKNPPGYFNPEYPNCPSLNLANSFVTYSHNGMGFGVNVNVRKDITYTLSILFYNSKNIVVHNPIYTKCINNGFKEKVPGDRPSKSATDQ